MARTLLAAVCAVAAVLVLSVGGCSSHADEMRACAAICEPSGVASFQIIPSLPPIHACVCKATTQDGGGR
jgi:hypothetical protein